MKWVKLYDSDVFSKADFIDRIDLQGRKICTIKAGQKLFAVQSKCPHAGADLSRGWCNNGNLVCPYHRHEFNLETGRGKAGQGNYIDIYPLDVRSDGVYIGLKKQWWKFW